MQNENYQNQTLIKKKLNTYYKRKKIIKIDITVKYRRQKNKTETSIERHE